MNPGATVAKNVVPKTSTSYGPLGALAPTSVAMTNRPQGAAGLRASDGTVFTFAGDASNLFLFGSDDTTFDVVSKSSGAYTTASVDHWRFARFGDRVIAINGHADHPQTWVMGTSTAFADLAGGGPRARQIGVIGDFLFMGDTYDSTDGSVPNRIWWSKINDPTTWPTIGSTAAADAQSDLQDLPLGGQVQAILGAIGGTDGAIISDTAIHRIHYVGPPSVFSIDAVEHARGTIAPQSVVNVGSFAFYLSEDGFYSFNGATSQQIGDDRVDAWFYSELNAGYPEKVYGAADTVNKVVYWGFPSTNSFDGTPDRIIMYNWGVDRWSYAEVDHEMLFRDLSHAYTMEGLDAVAASMDVLQVSLDSDYFKGGLQSLSAFTTANKLAIFSGDNMEATIETMEVGGPGMTLVNGIRPYVDGGTITVGLKTRDTPTVSEVLIGPNAVDFDGMAHFVKTARYHRAQVVIASASSWEHAQGVDYDSQQSSII